MAQQKNKLVRRAEIAGLIATVLGVAGFSSCAGSCSVNAYKDVVLSQKYEQMLEEYGEDCIIRNSNPLDFSVADRCIPLKNISSEEADSYLSSRRKYDLFIAWTFYSGFGLLAASGMAGTLRKKFKNQSL